MSRVRWIDFPFRLGTWCHEIRALVVREKDPMWCMVMFDLPVLTPADRRNANGFRRLLVDLGFCMLQLSVYVKYTPVAGGDKFIIKAVRAGIPVGGSVQIFYLTDRQWSKAGRFINDQPIPQPSAPDQLQIF